MPPTRRAGAAGAWPPRPERYGVPLVGGHTNQRAASGQLAVAILGAREAPAHRASMPRPGDALVMAIDLRGEFMEPHPFWNASTSAPAARLRADLALLPELAESGLCDAAKDISMAGAVGTTLMLLEGSGVGGLIDVARGAAPPRACRWRAGCRAFPSFGFRAGGAPRSHRCRARPLRARAGIAGGRGRPGRRRGQAACG